MISVWFSPPAKSNTMTIFVDPKVEGMNCSVITELQKMKNVAEVVDAMMTMTTVDKQVMSALMDENLESSGIDNLGPATTIMSMDSYLVKDEMVIISELGPVYNCQ